MSETLKLNMDFTTYCEIQKVVNRLKAKNIIIDIEKYASVKKGGSLLYDLICIELGAKESLKEPEFYN